MILGWCIQSLEQGCVWQEGMEDTPIKFVQIHATFPYLPIVKIQEVWDCKKKNPSKVVGLWRKSWDSLKPYF